MCYSLMEQSDTMEVSTHHQAQQVAEDGGLVSLSPEIIELIFAKMPVKAVVRASCVCRQWQSIVQSRHFVLYILRYQIHKRGRPL